MTVKEASGEIEIFKPGFDPNSVVEVADVAGSSKIVVSHPNLRASQIEQTILSKERYDKEEATNFAVERASVNFGTQIGLIAEIGSEIVDKVDGLIGRNNKDAAKRNDPQPEVIQVDFQSSIETTTTKNGVVMRVKDPHSKLLKVEFVDASGQIIEPAGFFSTDGVLSDDFANPLPKETRLRIYVATAKSLVKVPFTCKDIALP
jgi:hypothetical protein